MNEFWGGFLCASCMWIFVVAMSAIIIKCEPTYRDKLVIEYRNQESEYNRDVFTNIVYQTGIQTNFINKKVNMWKWGARMELVNPK